MLPLSAPRVSVPITAWPLRRLVKVPAAEAPMVWRLSGCRPPGMGSGGARPHHQGIDIDGALPPNTLSAAIDVQGAGARAIGGIPISAPPLRV